MKRRIITTSLILGALVIGTLVSCTAGNNSGKCVQAKEEDSALKEIDSAYNMNNGVVTVYEDTKNGNIIYVTSEGICAVPKHEVTK